MSVNRTDKILMCPAAGVHTGITDIMYKIGDYIKNKFPNDFFNTFHYETKDGFMSHYANIKRKRIQGVQSAYTKRKTPRLIILYDNRNSDTKDTGLGEVNPYTYPMSQGVHPDYHGYLPFFEDSNGLSLMTSDKRVKVELQMVIETKSVSDQEAVLNYLENSLKMQYGERLYGIEAKFILPNHLIRVLKNTLYYDSIQEALAEEDPIKRKRKLRAIQLTFDQYLMEHSGGNIEVRYKNKNFAKPYYIYKRFYRQIYFEVTGLPEKTDGEKKGEVYEKFSVTLNAFFEFYKPITYMLKSPEVVCNHIFEDIIKVSKNLDKSLNEKPVNTTTNMCKTKYHHITNNTLGKKRVIWKETDVTILPQEDVIDLEEWMDKPEHRKFLEFMKKCLQEDFDRIFFIDIYEGDVILNKDYYELKDRTKLYIYEGNPKYLYTIYLAGDLDAMNSLNLYYEIEGDDNE